MNNAACIPAIPDVGTKSKWCGQFLRDSLYNQPLPAKPACYVVYLDGVLTYIGSTANLCKRMLGHKIPISNVVTGITTPWGRTRCAFVKFRLSEKYGDWLMREVRLIKRLRPKGNRRGKPLGTPNNG